VRGASIAAAVCGLSLASASNAAGVVEAGSYCAANNFSGGNTMAPLLGAPGPLPLVAPSSGVVTKWKVNAGALEFPVLEELRLMRQVGGPEVLLTTAESEPELILPNQLNVFETRLPIQTGERFGVYGPEPFGTAYCSTGVETDSLVFKKVDATVGTTETYKALPQAQAAAVGVIEPDADADGYGDETQDRCPRSAPVQAECPPLSLGILARAGRNAATILVASSVEAPITVTGTVSLPGKAKAGTSSKTKLRAPARTVKPGAIVAFRLEFPRSLKAALAGTVRSRSLRLKVTAVGSNIAGLATSKVLIVKLRGRRAG
jgi:hypothetical protein